MYLLYLHLACCLYMTGLIWFVQVVSYPALIYFRDQDYAAAHQAYAARTGWVVVPPMLLELGSAIWLVAVAGPLRTWLVLDLVALLLIWASTFLLQVPCHRTLTDRGFDPAVLARLIRSNWIRTLLWSLRSLYLLYLVTMA